MINVLLVAGTAPRQETVLVEALERFGGQGVRVRLVCDFDLSRLTFDPAPAEVRGLRETTPEEQRRHGLGGEGSRAVWTRSWHDEVVRRWVREADVLVSLDMIAVYAVWEMAQRQLDADACHGLGPATRAVQARLAGAPRPKRSFRDAAAVRAGIVSRATRRNATAKVRRVVRIGMSPAVMRSGAGALFWRTAIAAPALPDRVRSGVAYRVHQRAVEAERPQQAAAASAAAVARMEDAAARAALLTKEATWELAIGRIPVALRAAVVAELAVADDLLKRKATARAAQSVHRAVRLLFHRVAHFEQPSSPLVEHPTEFLAPLRESAAGRVLATPRGRARNAAPPPTDRPLRLLVVAAGDARRYRTVRGRYDDRPDVEVQHVDLGDESDPTTVRTDPAAQVGHLLAGSSEYGNRMHEWLQPRMAWADVLVAEGAEAAAAVTLIDPGGTRIVVRPHPADLLTSWARLTDYSRVDEVVVASTAVLGLATAMLPQLSGDAAPVLSVVGDALDLSGYQRPKHPQARFTLGVLGVNAVDTRWAVEVLRELRVGDERYRLVLVGTELTPDPGMLVRRYHEELLADLSELERSGAVRRVEQVPDDVPEVLTGIGVILGSQVRETFRHAHVEGAASGAVPVLRGTALPADSPGGLQTAVPPEWVAYTPQQAAARIRDLTAGEERWRASGADVAAYALATWDWRSVGQHVDELLRIPATHPVG
ncbi:glycosyltransferase family 1 protein [Plantactinospora sp. WMMB334]|uniref:glycosyltransferase family 1 protein n=1 Tax=Plantactinospora sp. WMMB334 TaxID=3404119 RepID=UPI003B9454A1